MAALELPYPVSVGQLRAGDWSRSVPDRLEFEGRVGVPVLDLSTNSVGPLRWSVIVALS